ncbi:GNAT family N-acetyltransferase [Facklamia sp. P12945]|uniref:GNAT family N-acetyltransferase n=1 Tax=unclassified Facklamia TaxID=2622293 RepID=UPI003D185BDE
MKIVDDSRRLVAVDEQENTLAQMVYELTEGDKIWVTHTFTHPTNQGRGLAGELFNAMVDKARREGRKITSTCTYVTHKLAKDPEKYQDVTADS